MFGFVLVRTYAVSGLDWGICKVPENSVEGQFNFPYVIAVGLFDNQVSLPQFTKKRLSDPRVNNLASKVKVEIDNTLTARYPAEWCSNVTINMKNGKSYFMEVVGAKGDPQNPMNMEEVIGKFRTLTSRFIDKEAQNRICMAVNNLENMDDVSDLVKLLVI